MVSISSVSTIFVLSLSLLCSLSMAQKCVDCPRNAATCTYNNKTEYTTITSCIKNYYVDEVLNRCIGICKAAYYYDYDEDVCYACPSNAANCTKIDSTVVITICKTGYNLDVAANQCYKTCSTGQIYDKDERSCISCPTNCQTCKGTVDGVWTISAAKSGYSIDEISRICYKTCATNQYYSYDE